MLTSPTTARGLALLLTIWEVVKFIVMLMAGGKKFKKEKKLKAESYSIQKTG